MVAYVDCDCGQLARREYDYQKIEKQVFTNGCELESKIRTT